MPCDLRSEPTFAIDSTTIRTGPAADRRHSLESLDREGQRIRLSGTLHPVATDASAARRTRGTGSRALLFTLECALGIVAVCFIGLFAHWFQWLLPVSALLCLLIVVPTALLCGFWQAVVVSLSAVVVQSYVTARVSRFQPGCRSRQLRHPPGLRAHRSAGQPPLRARHRSMPKKPSRGAARCTISTSSRAALCR